jgi:hypothetical protein
MQNIRQKSKYSQKAPRTQNAIEPGRKLMPCKVVVKQDELSERRSWRDPVKRGLFLVSCL